MALLPGSGIVHAQRSSELLADLPDTRTMAIQNKVDALFEAGKFERAFLIYRDELVPIDDKYAQYMVGYMFLMGKGTYEDPVAASAWYRLAAERKTREFVAARDQVMRSLEDDEIRRSDALYYQLRLKYSDLAVLLASIKRNVRDLDTRTGSRVGSESSPVTIIDRRSGSYLSGDEYFRDIREQLEAGVLLLIEMGDFQDIDSDPNRINLHELERRVKEHLESSD
jgi:hypothetical protein